MLLSGGRRKTHFCRGHSHHRAPAARSLTHSDRAGWACWEGGASSAPLGRKTCVRQHSGCKDCFQTSWYLFKNTDCFQTLCSCLWETSKTSKHAVASKRSFCFQTASIEMLFHQVFMAGINLFIFVASTTSCCQSPPIMSSWSSSLLPASCLVFFRVAHCLGTRLNKHIICISVTFWLFSSQLLDLYKIFLRLQNCEQNSYDFTQQRSNWPDLLTQH